MPCQPTVALVATRWQWKERPGLWPTATRWCWHSADSTLALLGDCKRTEGLLKMASATLHPTDERSKTTVGCGGRMSNSSGGWSLISHPRAATGLRMALIHTEWGLTFSEISYSLSYSWIYQILKSLKMSTYGKWSLMEGSTVVKNMILVSDGPECTSV